MTILDVIPETSAAKWCYLPLNWTGGNAEPKANTWVHLLERLNPFCDDEALLLCQESDSKWVAWIPNHGEAVLDVSQFCFNP